MYVIKSPRLGKVGAKFVPKAGINVPALLFYGFIAEVADKAEVSTTAPKKGAKNKKEPKES